ncbi:Chromosome partition protein Smc [Streptococcus infantarius subsp. infantarius]|nr:Chromosome partition protein Smc [Streptococcus infantarius subsp. infantarius]
MSKNNVRIAIRDSTDSHNVAFFDNKSGIKYKSANLQRFLAGSASILTLKYNSKEIDSIRSGCKLAFRYKARDYWLNVMSFEKKGFEVELTAYSLGLELNNETRGEHKPANAMSIAEYVAYYDPEHALTIAVNEVSDKRIKLEWTGTDTILARLFSVANSFGAELDFSVELNDDYSLKRQVLNIYKKGNLGTNKVSQPVRVGKELKVINYSDNIKELRTAVRATGKDGLTIDGLDKKIYDNNKELLYYSSGMTVYAPQSRDRFPSVGKGSNDNWIVEDLGETQYETKEALWGYMYGEIQKKSLPEITYEVEGAIEAGIGDTQTLIDDIHFEPTLYVQARVSELEDDILTGKVTKSTFINFERKYSQIADILLKQVEALAEDAAPYIVRLSTDNGYNFKNGQGSSTITAKLEKYSKIVNAKWKWLINNSVVSETSSVTINASQVIGTLNVVAVASVDGNEVAREYITFTNADDGVGIKSITRYYTTNDQAEGVTAGGQNWATKPTTVTTDKKYMWSYDVITYTNDTSLVTEPAVIGARGDDGLDADTTGITEALDKAKQELTALSANIEKVRDDSLAAVEEAKQQLAAVANDLSTAKQDLQTQASQLQAQASAQSELTKRVSTVEETANGTKTTVSELSKTVAQNGKDITSVTARTKTVEDDLTSTKTTLSQVQTTANSANQKTATLETSLNGVKTDLTATTTTANTTKQNLASYQASNDKAVANLQSNLQTANGNISSLQTKIEAVPGQITSAVSAVEGKIPTSVGGRNLLATTNQGKAKWYWSTLNSGTTAEDYNVDGVNAVKLTRTIDGPTSWSYVQYQGLIRNLIEPNTKYTLSFDVYPSNDVTFSAILMVGDATAPLTDMVTMNKATANQWNKVSCVLTSKETLPDLLGQVVYLQGMPIAKGNYLIIKNIKLEKGVVSSDWSPAPEDYDSKLASAQSEIKQTTDAITASVSALDNSTVKSASLTINTDGIVMKAGKSTTDIANAIGSYFAVNQNAINLFADKIKVKGDMIVDGAITSTKIAAGAITADKIAANSINSSNIVSSGITANVIKGGVLQSLSNATNFELDTGKLFYNSNNTGVFRVEDGASTMGLKFSNTPITVNGTSRILSRVILGGDRRETSLDDGKWDQGGFSGIVAETINGVNSNQNEHADTLRVIGDNIYFTHSYDYDSSTGISAQGWKMETFSPFSSYPGNVVLKPYGVNYRQSDIITGDIRLDNGDGSGYWVRDCIRTLKRCFQHYLNGGTTSGAMNAIRDTLKDISGV